MLSCDTFALGKKYYIENKNCLGKNSDRPLGEAQPIAFYPGGKHPAGEMLKCTHLTIPQAAHTYTVLGCRPYLIWGFEMGVNEMGLAIGNEAEWSRSDAEIAAGAEEAEQQARQLIRVGSRTTACELLAAYTRAASDSAMGFVRRLCESVSSEIRKDGGLYGTRKEFLEEYCARVGMPL